MQLNHPLVSILLSPLESNFKTDNFGFNYIYRNVK